MKNTLLLKRLRAKFAPLRRRWEHWRNRGKPVEAVFTAIYQSGKWGGIQGGAYYSGAGSDREGIADAYLDLIRSEAEKMRFAGKRWLDLGCGDFRIGGALRPCAGSYTAVDVVGPLIEHLRRHWSGLPVDFVHADVTSMVTLPDAEVVFVRQVLQHLSNQQILLVLNKLKRYPLVYITEHIPSPGRPFKPNCDMTHGSGIRLYGGSGICLTDPPFSIPSKDLTLLLEVPVKFEGLNGDHGVLSTWRYCPS